jgi:hypothetical protein
MDKVHRRVVKLNSKPVLGVSVPVDLVRKYNLQPGDEILLVIDFPGYRRRKAEGAEAPQTET